MSNKLNDLMKYCLLKEKEMKLTNTSTNLISTFKIPKSQPSTSFKPPVKSELKNINNLKMSK